MPNFFGDAVIFFTACELPDLGTCRKDFLSSFHLLLNIIPARDFSFKKSGLSTVLVLEYGSFFKIK
jgi:hypothetical protein